MCRQQSRPRSLDVELWFVDLTSCRNALEEIERSMPRIDAGTRSRIERLKLAGVRQDRACAHIALRLIVERLAGPAWRQKPFQYSTSGKPALFGSGIAFSLSHTAGAALIAVGRDAPIGVDLEHRDRNVRLDPARRARMIQAARRLQPDAPGVGDSDVMFLQAWVRLEAYAKATGLGIGGVLSKMRRFEASAIGTEPSARGANEGKLFDSSIAVVDLAFETAYVGALALPRGLAAPVISHFPSSVGEITALAQGDNAM